MPNWNIPYTFSNGTTADANQVDQNFTSLQNLLNGGQDDANMKTGGLSKAIATEGVAPSQSIGLPYGIDVFGSTGFVVSGLTVTKDGTNLNQVNVAAGVAYVLQSSGSANGQLRRLTPTATNYRTSAANSTYYLDLNPDGSYTWGGHSTQTGYVTICTVTSDGSGNVLNVTDTRPSPQSTNSNTPSQPLTKDWNGNALNAAFSSPNSGAQTNQWVKIASVKIVAQYNDSMNIFYVFSGDTGNTVAAMGTYFWRVKQQATMGSAPIIELYQLSGNNYPFNYVATVTSENDASATVVDLYCKIANANDTLHYGPLAQFGTIPTWFSNQSLISTLPAGTQTVCGSGNSFLGVLSGNTQMQSGQSTVTGTSGSITYSTPFANASIAFIQPTNSGIVAWPTSMSKTGFSFANNGTNISYTYDWIALGY